MFKRIICIALTFALAATFIPIVNAAESSSARSMEDILADYHMDALVAETASESNSPSTYSLQNNESLKSLAQIQQDTVQALKSSGYDAYDLNASTFSNVERVLNTDLSSIGLDPRYSYVIVAGETNTRHTSGDGIELAAIDPSPIIDDGGGSDIFVYTLNGITYSMRYLTITSTNNPNYRKLTPRDLLASSYFEQLLQNGFDTAVAVALDYLSGFSLGTILSIAGFSPSMIFQEDPDSTLYIDMTTAWTRSFIQVWSEYDQAWAFASCAEYVNIYGKCHGIVYNPTTCSYEDASGTGKSKTVYSANYYNNDYRKRAAVTGFILSQTQYDLTGDVEFYFGDVYMVTHYENFV